MKITKQTMNEILDAINCGDLIEDEHGNAGFVMQIEKVSYKNGVHYYFKLEENKPTILILK